MTTKKKLTEAEKAERYDKIVAARKEYQKKRYARMRAALRKVEGK